ncbi:MAG: flagellar hook protein FlgE [Gammaproteobacteria bacterium]|nr:flagellar hook protein FlgE [Gammaproteobacteria bacterium]
MSYNIAISGLNAAQTDLEVTSHNIANASTVGFKEGRAEFADVYASTFGDVSAQASGRGVYVSQVSQQFSQGTVEFSGNNLDLAITGEGFFVTKNAAEEIFYTRAGQFSVNREGYVVNQAERRVQALPVTNGDSFDVDNLQFSSSAEPSALSDLQLPTALGRPKESTELKMGVNLDSAEDVIDPALRLAVGTFDVAAPPAEQSPPPATSYNHSTSTTFYDSLGQAHVANFYYVKTDPNEWEVYTAIERGDGYYELTGESPITLTFDTSGNLDLTVPPTATTATTTQINAATGAEELVVEIDFSEITQYGSSFDVNDLTQNGYSVGRLNGIDIGKEGIVFARYTNGQSQALGKIALANFNNPQGLAKSGDTAWQATYTSGDVRIGGPLTADFGSIQSGATEAANTDLASQLVKLIIAQRNYQANAQVITTNKTMTQTILNV